MEKLRIRIRVSGFDPYLTWYIYGSGFSKGSDPDPGLILTSGSNQDPGSATPDIIEVHATTTVHVSKPRNNRIPPYDSANRVHRAIRQDGYQRNRGPYNRAPYSYKN